MTKRPLQWEKAARKRDVWVCDLPAKCGRLHIKRIVPRGRFVCRLNGFQLDGTWDTSAEAKQEMEERFNPRVCKICGGSHPAGCCAQDGHG